MIQINIDEKAFVIEEKLDAKIDIRCESTLLSELRKKNIDVAKACREFLRQLNSSCRTKIRQASD